MDLHLSRKYTRDPLKKYEISDSALVKTLMVSPNNLGHDLSVKRIFSHMKGTPNLGLWYPKCLDFNLKGYSDLDYVGCNMDRKSTSSACKFLGGKLGCLSAKKQQSIAMSFDDAEYVAAARCCANILWRKSQLSDYDIKYKMDPDGLCHSRSGGNKSFTDQVNSNQQIIIFSLLIETKIDIGEIIFHDLVERLIEDPRKKHMAYLRFIFCVIEQLLGSNYAQDQSLGFTPFILNMLNYVRNPFEVTPVELTAYMLKVVEQENLVSLSLSHTDKPETRDATY
nr:hypothetical protein [Tanacetum cinerariifolium]